MSSVQLLEGAPAAACMCGGFKIVCNKHSPIRTGGKQQQVMLASYLDVSVTLSSERRRGYKDIINYHCCMVGSKSLPDIEDTFVLRTTSVWYTFI